jgi:hypothetical protein
LFEGLGKYGWIKMSSENRFNGKKPRSKIVTVSVAFFSLSLIIGLSFLYIPFSSPPVNIIPLISSPGLFGGSAASHLIEEDVETSFGIYSPHNLTFTPQNIPIEISDNLANVDLQQFSISESVKRQLVENGFALVDEGYEDIYEIYEGRDPKFITTDLCLHTYHVLYDISLRLLESDIFFTEFESMLLTLRNDQLSLYNSVTKPVVQDALLKNTAYLSVMLYLLNHTNTIPEIAYDLTWEELNCINNSITTASPIFDYIEDYSQYKVRGHYTRSPLLAHYFQAMMYAGRMSFLLEGPYNDVDMGIDQTRRALLLVSSFNSTINTSTVWDYWDAIYEPTAFYVGVSDDLTVRDYYQLWQSLGGQSGDQLADEDLILDFISEAENLSNPKINSMFVEESNTKGMRLLGQRFIPDSYMFQQLVLPYVPNRYMVNGLDVFSVLGSQLAAGFLQSENETYLKYGEQIELLRKQFSNLTDYDWTQNLYWSWLYSLFPLLKESQKGYPSFMQNNAWMIKTLMTVMGSWAELRHDTILYAKQSNTLSAPPPDYSRGYVEPYPEVYSRLSSLVSFMKSGLESRGLIIPDFHNKLTQIIQIFDKLITLSIKELETKPLSENDLDFIRYVGTNLENIASYYHPDSEWPVKMVDERMAVIADVHTDFNSGKVLEVATGDPYVIYVIVQDSKGNLRLTRGGTFSYYEFTQPLTNRLSDEEWHKLLDTNPPDIPNWNLHASLATQCSCQLAIDDNRIGYEVREMNYRES